MSKAEKECTRKDGRISFTTGLKCAARYLSDPDPVERREAAKLLSGLLAHFESGRDPIKASKLCGPQLLEAFSRNEPDAMSHLSQALLQLCRSLWIYHAYPELTKPLELYLTAHPDKVSAVAWLYECKLVLSDRTDAEDHFLHLQRLWEPAQRLSLAANFFEKGDVVDWRAIALTRAGAFFLQRSIGSDACKFRKKSSHDPSQAEQLALRRQAEALIEEALKIVEPRVEHDMQSTGLSAGERGFQSLPYFYSARLAELRGEPQLALEHYKTAQRIAKKLHLKWRLDDYDAAVERLSVSL